MRHIFIINPKAGKQNPGDYVQNLIKDAFRECDEEVILETSQYTGNAQEIVIKYANQNIPTTFYCCGGDGTLGEVVQPLIGMPHCAFAPIPMGTGNDFVKCFGKDAKERFSNIELLLNGSREKIDVLIADGKCCVNIASAGFDAMIAKKVQLFRSIPMINGSTAYNLSLAYCFFTSVKCNLGFEIDGKAYPKNDYVFAVIANGMYYGGGFKASPTSDIQDGLIDFITIPALPRIKMLSMIESYRKGEHLDKYDFITHTRCKNVKLLSDAVMPFNIDGNITMTKESYVEIIPGAVEIVLPYRP